MAYFTVEFLGNSYPVFIEPNYQECDKNYANRFDSIARVVEARLGAKLEEAKEAIKGENDFDNKARALDANYEEVIAKFRKEIDAEVKSYAAKCAKKNSVKSTNELEQSSI